MMNDTDMRDAEEELIQACARWSWDEKAIAAIFVVSVVAMLLGAI